MRKRTNSKRRHLRVTLEQLEQRMLLHAGHAVLDLETAHASEHAPDPMAEHEAEHVSEHATGDLSEHESQHESESHGDGHAVSSVVATDAMDPHDAAGHLDNDPVIFDELLGVPSGNPLEADALPDFFPTLSGSFSIDQTTQSGRSLLRFGTQVNNQGEGPAVLVSGRPGVDPIPSGAPITSWVNPDGSQNVLQAVYKFNGSSFSLSRYDIAGRFLFHDSHGHLHYEGYASYRLLHNNGGQPGGVVQRPDGRGSVGAKTGFCLINILSSFTMENGQDSSTLPGYNRPGQPNTGCGLLQGVHVGRADVYSAGLTAQWLDVTGVPNGNYFFEITLDYLGSIAETNETNNTKVFPVNINANPPVGGITPDEFDANGASNDTFAEATNMGVLGTLTKTGLNIHWGQDFDYFRFEASSTGTYTVTSSQSNGDVNIYLYDVNQIQLAASTKPSGSDTVNYDFVEGETYYLKAQSYNSTTSSNYQLAWNLKPKATSLTSVGLATETGQIGVFVVERNGPTDSPLTVTFDLTGDAVNGVDYQTVTTSVILSTLQSSAEIEIIPIPDGIPEGLENVVLTVTSNNAYVVGQTGTQLLISDNLNGDFDMDGTLGLADIDLLVENIAVGPPDPAVFDLTSDGLVNAEDVNEWLALAGALSLPSGNPYELGDANLDGFVDGRDFNIWNAHKFSTNPAWSKGDFTFDGIVDGADFGVWNSHKFTSSAGRSVVVLPLLDLSNVRQESAASRLRYHAVDLALNSLEERESFFFPH